MKFRKTIIAGVLALSVLGGGAAAAQADTNNPILAAIASLRSELAAALTGIVQQLSQIQTALQGLIPVASNTKTTIPVFAHDGANFVQCTATNLATEARTIGIQIINSGGQQNGTNTPVPIAPGGSTSFGVLVAAPGIYYCKYTVSTGTAADLKVSLTQIVNNTQIVAVVGEH